VGGREVPQNGLGTLSMLLALAVAKEQGLRLVKVQEVLPEAEICI